MYEETSSLMRKIASATEEKEIESQIPSVKDILDKLAN